MIAVRARALAPAAQAWLAHTTTARVLNVFDRACNLVNAAGQVLAVVTSERGLTPFALVVAASDPAPFRAVTGASAVRVQSGSLWLGPYAIELAAARVWDPRPDWAALGRLFTDPTRLDALAALAGGHGPAGSLLELLAPAGQAAALPAALASRARLGALDLVAGLYSGVVGQAVAGATRLAGLGGGLTPAGDDFVLGAVLAVWAGLYGAGAEKQVGRVVATAAPLTTTLSAAYLRAAAQGECSIYWHDLFAALLQPNSIDLPAALVALLAVGHTSGADALAGFLAARLVAGSRLTTPGG